MEQLYVYYQDCIFVTRTNVKNDKEENKQCSNYI